jgi:small multidrug resistance pump
MFVAWVSLTAAIASEIVGTLSLKPAGHGSLPALALVILGYAASFILMLVALKRMEVSMAYAIWSGVGTAVIALIGVAFLGESASAVKMASIALVIAGVVGLNLGGAH